MQMILESPISSLGGRRASHNIARINLLYGVSVSKSPTTFPVIFHRHYCIVQRGTQCNAPHMSCGSKDIELRSPHDVQHSRCVQYNDNSVLSPIEMRRLTTKAIDGMKQGIKISLHYTTASKSMLAFLEGAN